jgi:hypothetical protein
MRIQTHAMRGNKLPQAFATWEVPEPRENLALQIQIFCKAGMTFL